MDACRSFPTRHGVCFRFFDFACFHSLAERQKHGLVSTGFLLWIRVLIRSSRIIFLSYDLVHGNGYASAKTQAIILGDVSGTAISPFFVYYAELSGRHLYQVSRMEYPMWKSQGMLAQLTFRFLSMIRLEDDPFTFAQAHWMVAIAMLTVGNPNLAWKHYRRAITATRRHDIRFAPKIVAHQGTPSIVTGFIPSEGDHERVAFLAKILYFDTFLHFYVSGLPGTKVWANHDQEDRLPVWTRILLNASHRSDALIQALRTEICRRDSSGPWQPLRRARASIPA